MSVEGRDCAVCGRAIEKLDIAVLRACWRGSGNWRHLMCTRQGVDRWVREGRPGDGPLEWDRTERPAWWWDETCGTWWTHRQGDREVGHDPTRY